MKKAQLSINTVIMVIIALVVLAAVVLFFTGQFADSSAELDKYGPDETASSAGCQLACNMEKAGAGTPYTKKVCADKCPWNGCAGLIVNTMTDCPELTGVANLPDEDEDGVPDSIDCAPFDDTYPNPDFPNC